VRLRRRIKAWGKYLTGYLKVVRRRRGSELDRWGGMQVSMKRNEGCQCTLATWLHARMGSARRWPPQHTSDRRSADEGRRRRAAVTGHHGALQLTLSQGGSEHVTILVARGGDGWPAQRRQFGRRCHAGEQRRGDLGEERADRRAPSVSDGGVVTGSRMARA
jgi:hypothetical protein